MAPLRLRLRRSVVPTAIPVTRDEAKAQLNVTFDDDDDLIDRLIKTATADLDGKSGYIYKCLCPQTWVMTIDDGFPCLGQGLWEYADRPTDGRYWTASTHEARITIPLGPVIEVKCVQYVDTNGAAQTLDPSTYDVVPGSGLDDTYLVPKFNTVWPQTQRQGQAVTITYTAGYDVEDPDFHRLRSAILLHITHLYENRGILAGAGGATLLPDAYDALISPFKPVLL